MVNSSSTQKERMKNLVGMTLCAEDGPLGMSLAHHQPDTQALYVAVWRVAPSLLCFSSTPQRLPFSLGLAGGKLKLFCSRGFLGEAVKAVTVWAFISPEKRRGEKIEGESKRELMGGGVPKESLDTDDLVNWHPQ